LDLDTEYDEGPSKSQIKRELHAVHDLGRELVDLPDKLLVQLALPQDLVEEIRATRALTRGARKRQLRHIGGQLAHQDVDAIRETLRELLNPGRREVALFHEIEKWRDRLLEGGETAIDEFVAEYPHAERQQLRQLVRNAAKERTAAKPPRAARALFKTLRALLDPID